MQTSVNTIVKSLFQRNSLQEVSENQLQEYVKLFPYSSVGHLLLAKKRKTWVPITNRKPLLLLYMLIIHYGCIVLCMRIPSQ
jgi:hypothetical protein